jgi:hypothetical protein
MRLNQEKLERWWRKRTHSATFTARIGPDIFHAPTVNVYPMKKRKGFVWIIWHGKFGIGEIEKNIKTGGTTTRNRKRASLLAVHKLYNYRGRANE